MQPGIKNRYNKGNTHFSWNITTGMFNKHCCCSKTKKKILLKYFNGTMPKHLEKQAQSLTDCIYRSKCKTIWELHFCFKIYEGIKKELGKVPISSKCKYLNFSNTKFPHVPANQHSFAISKGWIIRFYFLTGTGIPSTWDTKRLD